MIELADYPEIVLTDDDIDELYREWKERWQKRMNRYEANKEEKK